ncbi:unnamed protein product [Ceratitis capitata]|uniref:(Mediterranean fruit fly) hypothetical protein n=1 Tax=Ceratitis capitata TaxID=7213 RepID=A0A811V0C9_CERCA|nr:unnamed protein product [Ceratitis capitata]
MHIAQHHHQQNQPTAAAAATTHAHPITTAIIQTTTQPTHHSIASVTGAAGVVGGGGGGNHTVLAHSHPLALAHSGAPADIATNANVAAIVPQPECSPRAVNMAMSPSPASLLPQQLQQQPPAQLQHQHSQQQQMGTKRNRVLTRQPRVKRDSDSLSNAQASPEPSGSCVDYDPFSNSPGSSSHSNYIPAHALQLHAHHGHHHLLAVPPRIERHSSEPAPTLTPSSPHLLSVPQNTPFLMKQHSDPLLPSQHSLSGAGALIVGGGGGTNPFAPLHRQYSHPLSCTTSGVSCGSSSAGTSHITSASLHHSHHISLPESMYTSGGSPPPVGSSQYVVPQQIAASGGNSVSGGLGTTKEALDVNTSATSASPSKMLSIPQFTTTYIDDSDASGRTNSPATTSSMIGAQHNTTSISSAPLERVRSAESNTPPPSAAKIRSSKSTSSVSLSERMSSLHPGTTATGSSSFEHLPSLRVKSEELQRSVSSPQTSREIITLENPRSSHCPVIRPGPALGCNFCWNTIDGHGRILRRKTKYHCPECQTNLCIVPCFQEYHERQNNEAASTSSGNDGNSKSYSGTTGRSGNSGNGGNSTRLYSKTETI